MVWIIGAIEAFPVAILDPVAARGRAVGPLGPPELVYVAIVSVPHLGLVPFCTILTVSLASKPEVS